ncbi:hypothetical protein OQA88_3631 [Cercophora sp. LCS_1]
MPYYIAPGRRSLRFSMPLPVILEDAVAVPPPVIPQKSPRRHTLNGYASHIIAPLSCAPVLQTSEIHHYSDDSAPDRKSDPPKEGLREVPWIARRGGWLRLVAVFLLFGSLLVGLAVGLTVGLKDRSRSPPTALPTDLFPTGSYSFTTALTNISTSCTTNPSTWRCFPYSVFDSANPGLSAATFNWIIQPISASAYVISSSDNPFAPSFTNTTLVRVDANQPEERFTFSFTMDKAVTPSAPLGGGNELATCWFNGTRMTATIWTKLRAEYPEDIKEVETPINATNLYRPWPFRVEVTHETVVAPECRDLKGRIVGGDLRTGEGEMCRCQYENFGLESG